MLTEKLERKLKSNLPNWLQNWVALPNVRFGLEWGGLLAVLIAALGLRLNHLTYFSLWLDESYEITSALVYSFWENLQYHGSRHPPIFTATMHLWIRIFGYSEIALRSFSVLAALITLLTVYLIARRWFNLKVAFSAALLLTFSPLQLYWSQSIRPYAFFTMLVALSMGLMLYVSEQPGKWRNWIFYGLSVIALLYVHYYAFHVIFAQIIFLGLVLYKNKNALLKAAITLILAGATFLPWLPYFLLQENEANNAYLLNRGVSQLVEVIAAFSGWFVPRPLIIVVGAVFIPLYGLGLWQTWQKNRRLAIWLVCWSFLPVATIWTSSFVRPNIFVLYLVFCVPGYLLTVAVGLWSLPRNWPYFLLVLALVLNLTSRSNYYNNYRYQDWRGIVNYIVTNQQKGDFVLMGSSRGWYTRPFN